jgi:hypothetical protein
VPVPVAYAEMTDQALLLEFGERGEGFLDGAFDWAGDAADAEIDDVEGVERQVAEVVVYGVDELLTRERVDPGLVFAAAGADLGDQYEAFRIGVECLFNDLVGDVRAVVVAGVDVVDAGRDCFLQDGMGFVHVTRRPIDAWAGELHCAIAHAVQGDGGAGEGEASAEGCWVRHWCLSSGSASEMEIEMREDYEPCLKHSLGG